jgi:hypothetical protein
MKRLRITHRTEYLYKAPVSFGPHRAVLRPREGHDAHVANSRIEIEPAAEVRWLRDINGNAVAILSLDDVAERLRLVSEVDVDLYNDSPIDCLVDPTAEFYPFQYAAQDQWSWFRTAFPATLTTAQL